MKLEQGKMIQIEFAKRSFLDAEKLCTSENEYDASRGIVALQDALELMIRAVDEGGKQSDTFGQILERVSFKIDFQDRNAIEDINKARVGVKHRGILVNKKNIINWLGISEKFLDEVSLKFVECRFLEINLYNFLEESDSKLYLRDAWNQIQNKEHYEALKNIRRALFLEFLLRYDISRFAKDNEYNFVQLLKFTSSAPYHTRSKMWCDAYVKDPFDYIVIDWNHLFQRLTTMGISLQAFENVYRLTPAVILYEQKWHDLDDFKIKTQVTESNTIYCYNMVVDMLLQKQQYESQNKYYDNGENVYFIAGEELILYEKAATSSKQVGFLKVGTKYSLKAKVPGLDGNLFYSIFGGDQEFIHGYILENQEINVI